MFQSIFNTLFGCAHPRTTFPLTPGGKSAGYGATRNATYVACLDCGQEFSYDWSQMRVGRPVAAPMPAYPALVPARPEPTITA